MTAMIGKELQIASLKLGSLNGTHLGFNNANVLVILRKLVENQRISLEKGAFQKERLVFQPTFGGEASSVGNMPSLKPRQPILLSRCFSFPKVGYGLIPWRVREKSWKWMIFWGEEVPVHFTECCFGLCVMLFPKVPWCFLRSLWQETWGWYQIEPSKVQKRLLTDIFIYIYINKYIIHIYSWLGHPPEITEKWIYLNFPGRWV